MHQNYLFIDSPLILVRQFSAISRFKAVAASKSKVVLSFVWYGISLPFPWHFVFFCNSMVLQLHFFTL
jgi:hypothetical protein